MSDLISIYVTASNRDEAEKLSLLLINKKLVACTNIIGEGVSIYPWQGKIEKEPEVYFMAKTTRKNFEEISSVIKENHSYDTPCIVAFPIIECSSDYEDWVKGEVK